MVYEPMAAANGIGIDVESPIGCMIVDIGGTTEIAVISLGGIVSKNTVRCAGRRWFKRTDFLNIWDVYTISK